MRNKRIWSVLIAIALSTCMVLSVSVRAFAAEEHTITVTTDGNGSVDAPATAEAGQRGIMALVTPNSGYVFDSCTATGIEKGEEGTVYNLAYSGWPTVGIYIEEMPDNDVSFHIHFAKAVTVTYDANGGATGPLWRDTEVYAQGVTTDFAIFDELIAPPEGKEYDGVEVNGVRFGPTDKYTYESDVTVVYQWKDPGVDDGLMCMVSYDPNGGTPDDRAVAGRFMPRGAQEEVRFVGELVDPPQGMTFDGIDVNGVIYHLRDTWTVPDAESVTVKFLWKSLDEGDPSDSEPGDGGTEDQAATCTIILDLNGAEKGDAWFESGEAEIGATVSIPLSEEGMAIAPPCTKYAGLEINGVVYTPGEDFVVPDAERVVAKFVWADAHNWGEWVVTKEATATENGERTRTCLNDPAHTQSEPIPATGQTGSPADQGDASETTGSAPQTGEATGFGLWLVLMAASLAAASLLVMRRSAGSRRR